jgi:transposase
MIGLVKPWHITNLNINTDNWQVDIDIDFQSGTKFQCPKCGRDGCSVHDTQNRKCRHLNLFQYKVYIHARVPRTECPEHGIHQTNIPWAREGSGFTLFFERLVMEFAQVMTVLDIAHMLGEHDTRLWRIINHYVEEAVKGQDLSEVSAIGVDETARRKGRKYITAFVNLETSRPILVVEGKGKETVGKFADFLDICGGDSRNILDFSSDMSPAFIAGIEENFPNARLTFDKFHVMKMMNEALDKVRRDEQKEFDELKGTKWYWLKGQDKLNQNQRELLNNLIGSKSAPKTTRAYGISQSLKRVYSSKEAEWAISALKSWYSWASHSRIEPVVSFARTIKNHWGGVINYFHSRWTNSTLEALNSVFKAFSKRARGYRSVKNAISAYYLACGKLKFSLPELIPG